LRPDDRKDLEKEAVDFDEIAEASLADRDYKSANDARSKASVIRDRLRAAVEAAPVVVEAIAPEIGVKRPKIGRRPSNPPVGFAAAVAAGQTTVAMCAKFQANDDTVARWRTLPEIRLQVSEIQRLASEAAAIELGALQGDAVSELARRLRAGHCQACGRSAPEDRDAIKLIVAILDRTGHPPRKAIEILAPPSAESEIPDADLDAAILAEAMRLCRLRDRHDVAGLIDDVMRGRRP